VKKVTIIVTWERSHYNRVNWPPAPAANPAPPGGDPFLGCAQTLGSGRAIEQL